MAIATYTDLQASIASWLHRSDLTAVIPDFITLAEARMNGDLVSRSMETTTPILTVAGNRFATLPTDMLEMKRLMLSATSPTRVLEYKSPDQLLQDAPDISATGEPVAFTVIGSQVELAPVPDAIYTLELVYIQKIPALASNATNWLLTANPNAYLFASLLASVDYTQDDSRMALWERKYQEAILTTNSIDWYSGSTMRVRAR
jgi:hypothetical protein